MPSHCLVFIVSNLYRMFDNSGIGILTGQRFKDVFLKANITVKVLALY
jgi:hypothetical protein